MFHSSSSDSSHCKLPPARTTIRLIPPYYRTSTFSEVGALDDLSTIVRTWELSKGSNEDPNECRGIDAILQLEVSSCRK